MHWQTSRYRIDLARPRVMGIVNVTPDSFYDGGRHASAAAAIRHCERLVAEGADIIDIGGESTRPGAVPPGAAEEWARLLPVLQQAVTLGVPVSIDTSEPEVMRQALALGADAINDVRALRRPGALDVLAAQPQAGVCLMHMDGEPATMQALAARADDRGDVVAEVLDFLRRRADDVQGAGVANERIVVDPGIGFAKTAADNLALLARQRELTRLGWPLLVGWSRKSTLGRITGRGVEQRLAASIAAALLAVQRGAAIVRVHDVAATVDALAVWQAVWQAAEGGTPVAAPDACTPAAAETGRADQRGKDLR